MFSTDNPFEISANFAMVTKSALVSWERLTLFSTDNPFEISANFTMVTKSAHVCLSYYGNGLKYERTELK